MRRVLGVLLIAGSLAVSGVVSAAVRPDHRGHGGSCYSTCASRTKLWIAPSFVEYGSEQDAVFYVFVGPRTPWVPGTPTGTVTVQYQSTVLCQITLSNGAGNCSTTSDALPAQHRPYCITAAYSGDTNFYASTSRVALLKVSDHHHHHHGGWSRR